MIYFPSKVELDIIQIRSDLPGDLICTECTLYMPKQIHYSVIYSTVIWLNYLLKWNKHPLNSNCWKNLYVEKFKVLMKLALCATTVYIAIIGFYFIDCLSNIESIKWVRSRTDLYIQVLWYNVLCLHFHWKMPFLNYRFRGITFKLSGSSSVEG